MAVILDISVSMVLTICLIVLFVLTVSGVLFWRCGNVDRGVTLIASGLIAFVVAGAQAEIENDHNLQADRQSLELAFAQTQNLTSGDFRGHDLHQFFIAYKTLSYGLFAGSSLQQASFRCDDLEASDFSDPGMPSAGGSGVTFTGDDIGSSDLDHTSLPGADFALVIGTPVPNAGRPTDLTGADLAGSVMFNVDFSQLQAPDVNLSNAKLYDVDLSYADLAGASLRDAMLGGPAYPRSSLKAGLAGLGPVDLRGADLQDANLDGANLKGAFLLGAQLNGATANRSTTFPKGYGLSSDGHHIVLSPRATPALAPAIPSPESPCPVASRPHRFG